MSDIPKRTLVDILDSQFARLSEEAYETREPDPDGNGPPPIGFQDKLRLFEAGQKWAATRNKVEPEESTDAFADARNKLVSGSRGRNTPPAPRTNGRA